MCGRLVLVHPRDAVAALLGALEMPVAWPVRYSLAPTDPVPVLRTPGKVELLRWGMRQDNPRTARFNARAENAGLYESERRCLVIASGFYEWKRAGGKKLPYFIRRADGAPVVFAGLVDASDGVAVVTAPAKGGVASLHDRMPVVLEAEAFAAYLDPRHGSAPFFAAASADALTMHPVRPDVARVKNDDLSLLEPVPELAPPSGPRQLHLF